MASAEPIEPEMEWTDEQVSGLEHLLERLCQDAQSIADRMDRMHGLMQNIIGDLRAAHNGDPQDGMRR